MIAAVSRLFDRHPLLCLAPDILLAFALIPGVKDPKKALVDELAQEGLRAIHARR